MNRQQLLGTIESLTEHIGTTWPLYSFVTSNPLSGYEDSTFFEAVAKAKNLLGNRVFPDNSMFKKALETGAINAEILSKSLREAGFEKEPKTYLNTLQPSQDLLKNNMHKVDCMLIKWLSFFMDEGLADWAMPHKEKGFYAAWQQLARYDYDIDYKMPIPKTNVEAISQALSNCSENEVQDILEEQLSALPGWTGYIKYRMDSDSAWQQKYPITITDYLAVRLWVAKTYEFDLNDRQNRHQKGDQKHLLLQQVFLNAWEETWQKNLIKKLSHSPQPKTANSQRPEAQLVFCIDTRSEPIRKKIEEQGHYQTLGYAGFFGIPMEYCSPEDELAKKSCPPIVPTAYSVSEAPHNEQPKKLAHYRRRKDQVKFSNYFLKRMKNILPSAFGFVEGSGLFYAVSLIIRTLKPNSSRYLKLKHTETYESLYEPKLKRVTTEKKDPQIPTEEKAALVKTAFDLCGWKTFAPLVVFTGHGSHTANNPFGASLDCGACAGNPGKNNARMLAKLANEQQVRQLLIEQHGFQIPEDTVFMGGEHNTTTDEIILFDRGVPDSHQTYLKRLKSSLKNAQYETAKERLNMSETKPNEIYKKSTNWAETRPEWGLAKNAGFIIGPRSLTENTNLEGSCFLNSYDWQTDPEGTALEAIMQGPMVVTQWINNHYYFSTVDNDNFGGGSKITHNITGKYGVVQGNGGDLKMGLPLQSLMTSDNELYHQPLRLSVIIQAPKERVEHILDKNPKLKSLIDNQWLHLMIMDPQKNNTERYRKGMSWEAA